MSEKLGISVEEIFDTMGKRFRPEGAEGLNESYGYDIEEKGKWKLEIRDGSMTVGLSDDLSDCICVMKADADSFVGTQIGTVDWDEAFSSGKISVDGNRDALDRTKRIFKKFTAPGEDVEVDPESPGLRSPAVHPSSRSGQAPQDPRRFPPPGAARLPVRRPHHAQRPGWPWPLPTPVLHLP